MSNNTPDVDLVTTMSEFASVFAELKKADLRNGEQIEKSLRSALQECHDGLRSSSDSPDQLRYWLYREAVELKAQASVYLNYEREMAQRQAALWRFALERNDQFFTLVCDALDDYFTAKTDIIIADVEKDARWYSNLRDTAKQAGVVVTGAAGLLHKGMGFLKDAPIGERAQRVIAKASEHVEDVASLDTRDIVRKAMGAHLSPEILGADVEKILSEAAARYEKAWTDELKAQAPDLQALHAFSESTVEGPTVTGPSLGPAEQALAVGLGGALAGTISLAAGWHVLAYAMVNVFYPAAILVALATVGVAVLAKEKDLERRRRKVREAIDQYHRHFLVQIDTGRLAQLGGKTLREAMRDQVTELVTSTLRGWEKAIGGDLTTDHYRMLGMACTAHLQRIQECLKALPEPRTAAL
jgi:hypothetical protein